MDWWKEAAVEAAVKEYFTGRGWRTLSPRSTVDLLVSKREEVFLIEVKGDVGAWGQPVQNPNGQRLKYLQNALGQLVIGATTEYRSGKLSDIPLLGIALPDPCSDGSSYFRDKAEEALRTTVIEPGFHLYFVSSSGVHTSYCPYEEAYAGGKNPCPCPRVE